MDTNSQQAKAELRQNLLNHPLFIEIKDDVLPFIIDYFELIEVSPGEEIIQEDEHQPQILFAIISGTLEVTKKVIQQDLDRRTGVGIDQIIIATLSTGDIFGELTFIEKEEKKTASVRCISRARVLSVTRKKFKQLETENPVVANRLLTNMIAIIGKRLKRSSQGEVKALNEILQQSLLNTRANLFFSYVIGLLCLYNLTIQIITELSVNPDQASLISAAIIAIFAGGLILMVRETKIPRIRFGLTIKNWKPALRESMVWTLLIITVLILVKWLLVNTVPQYQYLPVIDFQPMGQNYLTFNFILYGLHSPVQEFVARGVLQGSLQNIYTGKYSTMRAILVSNALFAATHVHLLNGMLGLIVFFPGLFWGWLYSRHENLIGVSISHLLIGWTALFLLNPESLLKVNL